MSEHYKNAQEYFRVHWVAMLLTAIPTLVVAVIAIFGTILSFRLDYQALKLNVDAQGVQEVLLNNNQQTLLTQVSAIRQSQKDNKTTLDSIQTEVLNIYNLVK